jgi:Rod binding domain-containing protein
MEILLLGLNPYLSRKDPEGVAKAFEALFLETLLRGMNKTILRSNLFPQRTETKIYQDLFSQVLALELSKSGGLGLSQKLLEALKGTKVPAKNADKNKGGGT